MTTHTETMWAIAGKDGLYPGTGSRWENAAIYRHCWPQNGHATLKTFWARRRKRGDRAVPVTITYEYPE